MPALASTSPQSPGIDTMPLSPTPMHDGIGSGNKKKSDRLRKIFNIFTCGKDKHGPGSATKRSFDDGTYGQRGPVVQRPVGAMDDLNGSLDHCRTRRATKAARLAPVGPVLGRPCTRQPSGGSTTLLKVRERMARSFRWHQVAHCRARRTTGSHGVRATPRSTHYPACR